MCSALCICVRFVTYRSFHVEFQKRTLPGRILLAIKLLFRSSDLLLMFQHQIAEGFLLFIDKLHEQQMRFINYSIAEHIVLVLYAWCYLLGLRNLSFETCDGFWHVEHG